MCRNRQLRTVLPPDRHTRTDAAQVDGEASRQKETGDGRQAGRHTHKQMGRQAVLAGRQTQAVRLAHTNNEMHQIHIEINNF